MKGPGRFLDMKYGELIFGLVCGCSYFIILLNFIFANTYDAGSLLALFLAPLIICGIALVFIKIIRNWRNNEQYKLINSFIILHLFVLIIAVIFLIDYCMNGIV